MKLSEVYNTWELNQCIRVHIEVSRYSLWCDTTQLMTMMMVVMMIQLNYVD